MRQIIRLVTTHTKVPSITLDVNAGSANVGTQVLDHGFNLVLQNYWSFLCRYLHYILNLKELITILSFDVGWSQRKSGRPAAIVGYCNQWFHSSSSRSDCDKTTRWCMGSSVGRTCFPILVDWSRRTSVGYHLIGSTSFATQSNWHQSRWLVWISMLIWRSVHF